LVCPDLAIEFIPNAVEFLEDVEANYDISILLTLIEGLCLIAI
jgi:hypothetical protein